MKSIKKMINGSTFYENEHGQRHREDGPAIITADGHKYWMLNGKWHRTDGPAWITPDGVEYFCLDESRTFNKEEWFSWLTDEQREIAIWNM